MRHTTTNYSDHPAVHNGQLNVVDDQGGSVERIIVAPLSSITYIESVMDANTVVIHLLGGDVIGVDFNEWMVETGDCGQAQSDFFEGLAAAVRRQLAP